MPSKVIEGEYIVVFKNEASTDEGEMHATITVQIGRPKCVPASVIVEHCMI